MMKTMRIVAAFLVAVMLLAQTGRAQEKPKAAPQEAPKAPAPEPKHATFLKVQAALSEYEGEKKISSLPYTFFVAADSRETARVRMGLRVPVHVGSTTPGAASQIQYMDVGTNLDCLASTVDEGRFKLDFTVERSSLYTAGAEKKPVESSAGDVPLSPQPIVRQFRANSNFLIRDGQTVQSTLATDPVSGRVLKVDVTVNVVR